MIVRALPLALLLASTSLFAANSAPQPVPIPDTIPAPRDVAYPGTLTLEIDATDVARGIVSTRETIPVAAAGPMVLLYPEWLPGNHSTTGPISKLAGLIITANGKRIEWTRDPVDMYAFHIDVPAGVKRLDIQLKYLSPTDGAQGRIQMTPNMQSLQWEKVSLYPAGYFTRRIPVSASVTYPAGWTAASGLPATVSGATYRYETTSYETLVDSPVIAGRYYRKVALTPRVDLDIVADSAAELEATPAQIDAHKALVAQATSLFGSQHYDRYHFLLSISNEMGGIGLEHHRSSEDGTGLGYFTKWNDGPGSRGLLPHEFTHSWNGKFRRPADLWTPDYRTPMQNSLLWVYEGQTQFWGYVLQARSGLISKQDTLDTLASVAATFDNLPAREWRDLADTTNDPIMGYRQPKPWQSYQRGTDYYTEGALVWLEVDSILRAQSGGTKSMDDFAHAFFSINDGDWGEVTYSFDDIVKTLQSIVPYDWAALLSARLTEHAPGAPLKGLTDNGYRLVYTDKQTPYLKDRERSARVTDLSYSLGLVVSSRTHAVTSVMWDGPAFNAGLDIGTEIVAINAVSYSDDALRQAVADARNGKDPIRLLVKNGERFREVAIDYHGGLRYPRLEKTGTGEGGLDRLLAAKP